MMDDYRLLWIKEIVYRFLQIDAADQAFNELLERDTSCESVLRNVLTEPKKMHHCLFFYSSIKEEEVEKADTIGHLTEVAASEKSESSGSMKLDSENSSISDQAENLGETDTPKSDPFDEDNEQEDFDILQERRKDSKKSTISLRQIIKKKVLHLCFNITEFKPSRRHVYFLLHTGRTVPPLKSLEEGYSVMLKVFEIGSINQHPLTAMKQVVSYLYLPLFSNQKLVFHKFAADGTIEKKKISAALRHFCPELKNFVRATNEAAAEIERPFSFHLPEIPDNCSLSDLSQEIEFVSECKDFTSEWTGILSELLNTAAEKEPPENDIFEEIKFWKEKKLLLSTCYDHLHHKTVQETVRILELADSDLEEFNFKVKEIENELHTATENVNYLSILEHNLQNLSPEKSLKDAEKSLDDVFLLLKMIWIQSNYYGLNSNMSRLIKGIAFLLKEKVKQQARVDILFRNSLSQIYKIVTESKKLLTHWKEIYNQTYEDVKKYGEPYWWGFNVKDFFSETDYIIEICSDLEEIAKTLMELYNIFNTNLKFFAQDLKSLAVLKTRIFGMTSRIQYVDYDVFNSETNSKWKKIISIFYRDVENFESEIKSYLFNVFHSNLSWENASFITKSFESTSVSKNIKEFIRKNEDDMLKQFIREITENEHNFLSNKDHPPHFESIPEVTSSIMWVKDLLIKISKPTTQICAQGILSRRKVEVQERFKTTEALYTAYMLEKYNKWKIIAEEKLNKFLHSKVLKKFQPQSMKSLSATSVPDILNYKVNFLTHLEDVSVEAKILEHMGYEVPIFVRNIILQERIYYKYRNKLKIILKRMKNALLNLKPHEIKLLNKSAESLCIVLQQGTELQWESSEISLYLKKLKQTVDVFAGIMTQAKSIFYEIEKQIKRLSTFQLFTFTDMKAFDNITNCEVFFERAEAAVNAQIKKVVETNNTLPPLLKNLEQVTCQTATGRAKSLSQYYSYCEENILLSLIEMMIMNLKYLKDELWDQFFIPNIQKFWYSNEELDKLSFARIKWAFVIFMKNISECTRNVKRWLQGTCIESPTFFTKDAGEIEFSYYLDLSLHPEIKELVLCIISWFLSYMKKLETE